MKKRVFIIHGWEGYPQEGWFPWLKKELEKRGFKVEVPQMPNPDEPQLTKWLSHLQRIIINPDEQTYFVGHSLGCITILHYLENLPDNIKVSGVVLVAGFPKPIGYNELNSFVDKPLNYQKIKSHTDKFVAIHSDDDPYVSLKNGQIFQKELDAKLIIKKRMKHFSGDEGVKKLPVALESILELTN